MAEITLGNAKEKKVLKVNIGNRTYSVPLRESLTLGEVKEFKKAAEEGDNLALFKKSIPENVLDGLTVPEIQELTEAWKNASESDDQPDMGE